MAPKKPHIQQKQLLRQELWLTPQLLQSMEVLQMNTEELLEHINAALEENPVLERGEDKEKLRQYIQLRSHAAWLAADAARPAESAARRGNPELEAEQLNVFLCEQLERQVKDQALLALCRYMAQLVDEDGYLRQEELDSVAELGVPPKMLAEALGILQQLEPAGVAARDLSECLLLQLRRSGEEDPVTLAIVQRYLAPLGRGHYGAIAKELHCNEGRVRAAEKKITALRPKPGSDFGRNVETVYVRPDVFVLEVDGQWQTICNEYYLPSISVNPYYEQLLRQTDEEETAKYLREKMRQAHTLLRNLERRGNTLQRCADAILHQQLEFFAERTDELLPMTLRRLAQDLQLHPSTVTRALRGKYLQCRRGIYPMRYFFSQETGGTSRQAVQAKLLHLVKEETPGKPYSDEKLCALLAQQGVTVARRTVAKYREELQIPPAAKRKRKEK